MPNVTYGEDSEFEEDLSHLIGRVQEGDTHAFEQILSRFRNRVYALTWNIVRNEEDASDITQETFIKAWKSMKNFKGTASFPAWLFRISINLSIDYLRHRKISPSVELDRAEVFIDPGAYTVPSIPLAPAETLEKKEVIYFVQSAIAELSPDHRIVILLKEVEGLSYKEIATVVGVSLGTIMSRIFYARKELQNKLKGFWNEL